MIFPAKVERGRRFIKKKIFPICMRVSHVVATRETFRKMVDGAKEIVMIQYEGLEQHEGDSSSHSGDIVVLHLVTEVSQELRPTKTLFRKIFITKNIFLRTKHVLDLNSFPLEFRNKMIYKTKLITKRDHKTKLSISGFTAVKH